MRVLAFLAVTGSVLMALLLLANAMLEKDDSPAIVTSQRTGLPESPRHSSETNILTSAAAPAPDMTSQAVLDAQPKRQPEPVAKIEPAARAARAEASPKNTRIVSQPPIDYQQHQSGLVDRFSIKGQ